jgi:hypothetical protein
MRRGVLTFQRLSQDANVHIPVFINLSDFWMVAQLELQLSPVKRKRKALLWVARLNLNGYGW